MKLIATIAATLLGLMFIAFSSMVLFHLGPTPPPPPADTPAGHFMAGFGPTGYLTLVKVCELVGGILTIIPKTRLIGMLILTPIIVNILAFHGLVAGSGLFSPVLIAIVILAAIVLLDGRRQFMQLLR